jgi:hypothetical protein
MALEILLLKRGGLNSAGSIPPTCLWLHSFPTTYQWCGLFVYNDLRWEAIGNFVDVVEEYRYIYLTVKCKQQQVKTAFLTSEKSEDIKSKAVNCWRKDNSMTKRKMTKRQKMIHKTLHSKLKIENLWDLS